MKLACLTMGAAALMAAAATAQNRDDVPAPPRAAAQPATAQPAPRGVQVEGRAAQGRAVEGRAAAPQADEQGFYRASEIIGMSVRGNGGQELGQIQDLMIDGRSQQIRYFILSSGEKVSANSKLTVMPWAVAQPHFGEAQDQRYVGVEFEQDRLRQAPTFTQQQLQAPRATWYQDVDRFYGVRQGVARPNLRGGNIEVDDDGEVEVEGRLPRGARGPREGEFRQPDGSKVEVERDGDEVKIERERD